MYVCRACLLMLENVPRYSIYHPSEHNLRNNSSNSIPLRTMIEKCMPEMVGFPKFIVARPHCSVTGPGYMW